MPVNSYNPHDQRQDQPNNLPRRVSDPQKLAELRAPQVLPAELQRVAARHYELARCQDILGYRTELAAVAQVAHAVVLCHIDANPGKLIPALKAAVQEAERHRIAARPRGLKARAELALLLLQQGDTHGALRHLEFLDAQPKYPLDKLSVAAKAVAFELSHARTAGPSAVAVGLLKRALSIEAGEKVQDREPTVENLLAGLLVDWGDRGTPND